MYRAFLNTLGASTWLEFCAKALIWFLAIIGPLFDLVGSIFLLIIVDFIFGWAAAYKEKVGFQLSKVVNTLNKFLFYALLLFTVGLIEIKLITLVPLLSLVAGYLALVELRSIARNFEIIFKIKLWDFIRAQLKREKVEHLVKDSEK
tara:strand:+ start:674 stop:1114 length:441 start_codon:yes stop_codon:yes gene_type:complete